jgi:hypothetical protein
MSGGPKIPTDFDRVAFLVDYVPRQEAAQAHALVRVWKGTADRLAERVDVLEAALQQAYQCCARPSGVCFDPSIIPPETGSEVHQYDGADDGR